MKRRGVRGRGGEAFLVQSSAGQGARTRSGQGWTSGDILSMNIGERASARKADGRDGSRKSFARVPGGGHKRGRKIEPK
jgi:hypothetical protein